MAKQARMELQQEARSEMGAPSGRGRYTIAMLMADAERAFTAAFPARAQMILAALEHLCLKRRTEKRERGELRAAMKREGSHETDFAFDVIYVCEHVSAIVNRNSWASITCRECGRSWPTPQDLIDKRRHL